MSKQMNFDPNKIDGCYPKCLKKPFLIFVAVVIVAMFVAVLCCVGGVADCCKSQTFAESSVESTLDSTQTSQENIAQVPETPQEAPVQKPKEPEKFDDIKQKGEVLGATVTLAKPQEKPASQVAKEQFLNYGKIHNDYKIKFSVFFDKNSSYLGKKQQATFANSLQNNANDAKVALVMGYGCDLGDKQYNFVLINKRIERVIKAIKKQYPRIEILSSNEGQIHTENIDEKGRETERRVDVYFY